MPTIVPEKMLHEQQRIVVSRVFTHHRMDSFFQGVSNGFSYRDAAVVQITFQLAQVGDRRAFVIGVRPPQRCRVLWRHLFEPELPRVVHVRKLRIERPTVF